MKKIYQNPTVTIVKIQPACIMTESIVKGQEFNAKNGDVFLGRRGRNDIWDDEEDDE